MTTIEPKGIPLRLTVRRHPGFRLHETSLAINGLPAVKVTRPGKFGNPFVVKDGITPALCVAAFKDWLDGKDPDLMPQRRAALLAGLPELRGKNLACWCSQKDPQGNPVPCHATVLLELANRKAGA